MAGLYGRYLSIQICAMGAAAVYALSNVSCAKTLLVYRYLCAALRYSAGWPFCLSGTRAMASIRMRWIESNLHGKSHQQDDPYPITDQRVRPMQVERLSHSQLSAHPTRAQLQWRLTTRTGRILTMAGTRTAAPSSVTALIHADSRNDAYRPYP